VRSGQHALLKSRFLLLLLAAILLSGLSGIYFIRYLFKPNTGLVVNYPEVVRREGRIVFAPKTPFSPAASSGLEPNRDQIVRINGREITSIRDVVETDAAIWSFQAFPVEVLRDGTERRVIRITPVLTPSRVDWVFALIFCAALSFTAFYLIVNLPEDRASNFLALAALFYLVFTAVKPFYYESFLANLVIHLGKLTSWLLVCFALYFPVPKGSRRARHSLMLSVAAVYLVFIVVRMVYYGYWAGSGQDEWLVRYRFLGKLNNIADGIAFILFAVLLSNSYLKTPSLQEKRQIEWILAGFLIAIPPYFFLDQLPIILGEPPGLRISMGNFANLFLAFLPLFVLIGLIKHRVFNVKFFLSRYVVYLVLVVLIFSFFTVLYDPFQNLFVHNYGLPVHIAGFLVTALLFLALIPLRTLLLKLAERLFYRSHYRKSLLYSVSLETKNMELMLIIDELNRQKMRSFQTDKLKELRGIITGIAHRINNPANYISSGLSSLEKKLLNLFADLRRHYPESQDLAATEKEIARFLGIAQEGDLLIKDFVRKLVTLAGSRATIPVSVTAGHLIRNAELEIRKTYPQARLRCEIRSSQKLTCYPGELIQALTYVLANAVEAGAQEEIALSAEDRDGYVAIEVADRGVGIDEHNLKKVFDPFFSTKADHEGLGLYFCRTIVERNSGSIDLTSKAGGGTRVRLLLARGKRDAARRSAAGGNG
jgi:signal transduction histidine kinase